MVQMVRMVATSRMTRALARRLSYRTRMMVAEGDEFEVAPSVARTLRVMRYAENVAAGAAGAAPEPARRRRGRPPKVRAPQQLEEQPGAVSEDEHPAGRLEDMTVTALRQVCEARGIELPSSYLTHDRLVKILRDRQVAEAVQASPDTGQSA